MNTLNAETSRILVGKKIASIRQLTKEELEEEGWDKGTTAIVLDDGTLVYPSQDDEGNGPGALFGIKDKLPVRLGYQD